MTITNKAQTYTILLVAVMSEMGRGEGRDRKVGGAWGGGGGETPILYCFRQWCEVKVQMIHFTTFSTAATYTHTYTQTWPHTKMRPHACTCAGIMRPVLYCLHTISITHMKYNIHYENSTRPWPNFLMFSLKQPCLKVFFFQHQINI